jgi:hypothetical protein
MEEAPENGKELSHSTHANRIEHNRMEQISICHTVFTKNKLSLHNKLHFFKLCQTSCKNNVMFSGFINPFDFYTKVII